MKINDIKKVELKGIKWFKAGSQETLDYVATVYVNGKKAVSVSNNGWGGPDLQHQIKPFTNEDLKVLDTYIKHHSKAHVFMGEAVFGNLESWCIDQIIRNDELKKLKKRMKKDMIFLTSKDQPGHSYSYIPIPKETNGIPRLLKYIHGKYPDATIFCRHTPEQVYDALFPMGEDEFMPKFNKKGICTNVPKAVKK